MPSNVDPAVPVAGNPTTASVRGNFVTIKNEIETLQAQIAGILAAFQNRAVIVADYPDGTNVPAPTINTWQTRPLNTILSNGGFLVSLANNQFTLPAGNYHLRSEFQSYKCDRTRFRLQDTATPATLDTSINEFITTVASASNTSIMESWITLNAQTTLAYQQIFSSADATFGWGIADAHGTTERFGRVTITKLPD